MVHITRRSTLPLLSGLAAAAGLPAGAETGDPIYRFVDNHRAAYVRFIAVVNQDDSGAGIGPATLAAYGEAADLFDQLIRTPPGTLAGCIALLHYLAQLEHGGAGVEHEFVQEWPPGAERELRQTLRQALARIATPAGV